MNRHDEIQALARDIASNVHNEPGPRNEMADQLIRLISLMLGAQGKYLAVYGEGELSDAHGWEFELDTESVAYTDEEVADKEAEFEREQREECAKFHGIFVAGERMQDAARELAEACTNPRVDLERYGRPTGHERCVCGHVPSVHQDGVCTGEQYNREACKGGACPGFRAQVREHVWTHTDRRPEYLRNADAAPEGCGRCTQSTPCADPKAGCYAVPPVSGLSPRWTDTV